MSVEQFFKFEEADGALVVAPRVTGGPFAEEASREVWPELFQRVDESDKNIVIDLHSLKFFGSILLELIATLNKHLKPKGRHLALCRVSPAGLEVMKIAKFDKLWPIRSTVAEAAQAVNELGAV
jgi:anti-anti-sigma factor